MSLSHDTSQKSLTTLLVHTVNQADIDNYQNQIGIARTSSAKFGEELAKIDADKTKRSTEKEKLQNSYVSLLCGMRWPLALLIRSIAPGGGPSRNHANREYAEAYPISQDGQRCVCMGRHQSTWLIEMAFQMSPCANWID